MGRDLRLVKIVGRFYILSYLIMLVSHLWELNMEIGKGSKKLVELTRVK